MYVYCIETRLPYWPTWVKRLYINIFPFDHKLYRRHQPFSFLILAVNMVRNIGNRARLAGCVLFFKDSDRRGKPGWLILFDNFFSTTRILSSMLCKKYFTANFPLEFWLWHKGSDIRLKCGLRLVCFLVEVAIFTPHLHSNAVNDAAVRVRVYESHFKFSLEK